MLVEAEAFYGVGCRALNPGRAVCGEEQLLTFENALLNTLFNNPTLKNTVLIFWLGLTPGQAELSVGVKQA